MQGIGGDTLSMISVVLLPINFVTLIGTIFAAGRAVQKLDDLKETVRSFGDRLSKMEDRVTDSPVRRTIWEEPGRPPVR